MNNQRHSRETTSIALFSGGTKRAGPQTFICFGTPRGGTSMIAGAMAALGVDMGSRLEDNQEDPIFNGRDGASMRAEILRRKEAGDPFWGWKFPNAANYLDQLRPHLTNPRLIVVMRDPVATTKGHIRWHNREALTALTDVFLSAQRNFYLCLRWQVPSLLISYEKAAAFPENFAREFCEFANLAIPDDLSRLLSFMTPGSYKPAPSQAIAKP